MEAYPEEYVAHNLPLLVLSGLPQAGNVRASPELSSAAGSGVRLASDLPPLSGSRAEQLLETLLRADGASLPWSDQGPAERAGLIGFKISAIGRTFNFPLRKAAPPPISPDLSSAQNSTTSPPPGLELHSPLSPLSPSSPIFPDGLMTPMWLAKHQSNVPSMFLSFYHIGRDESQDSQLKTDINATKGVLSRSGFKTRYAAVLVADRGIADSPELEERFAAIRRATALDPKTGLFFLGSDDDLSSFVVSTLSALQPSCIDYYRDLTKHARRKKSRGYAPTASAASARGTSQSLTLHGWNVRYDFKLAVFAEFRQEMDSCQRHYESALEVLFDPEGYLETTPSWSPRWNDCRILCDIIAFRILRCQIWRGMTTSAAESWSNYKYRMKDLVDRRGKGTDGYGWEAWEARWAKMMAQLIEMAELPVFKQTELSESQNLAQISLLLPYAQPEKAFSTADRLPPFHYLHHPGYWWRIVSKHILARRRKAEAIPVEDRLPLNQVTASQAASRVRTYDTYLVPQPHEEIPESGHAVYDYLLDVQSQTERAESEFASRGQTRAVQYVRFELARELDRAERYGEALDLLRPVWDDMTWRREGWLDLAADVVQIMHRCAINVGDKKMAVEVAWEMVSQALRCQEPVDLLQSLELTRDSEQDIVLSLNSQTRLSPVDLKFAFMSSEGFVGSSVPAQIVMRFNASPKCAPITLSVLRIHFGSNFRSLQISHVESTDDFITQLKDLREEHDPSHPMAKSLHCSADLRLRPGQTRVFNVLIPLREVDNFNTTGASFTLGQRGAVLEYMYTRPTDIQAQYWLLQTNGDVTKKAISRAESTTVNVLPKPPKMQIRILNPRDQFFTNENVSLEVEAANEEDEEADVNLSAKVQDEAGSPVSFTWHTDGEETPSNDISSLSIGKIQAAGSSTYRLVLSPPSDPSTYTLAITVSYHIESSPDQDTPFSKTLTLDIPFVSPFEANYDFGPRLHLEEYPSFFSLPKISTDGPEGGRIPQGVEQRWCLTSRVASFASEPLIVESTSILVNKITSNAVCLLDEPSDEPEAAITIEARGRADYPHIFNTRKFSLEDRRAAALDLSLSIVWRRMNASPNTSTTTLLVVPNLTIPNAEPRVLCTVESRPPDTDVLAMQYTLENPSMHFLNFTLTMEASDEFAFSGPKFRSVSVTPMSRVKVQFNLLVYDREDDERLTIAGGQRGYWIWPVLRVMDPYFNRALRVQDGGPGVMTNERGDIGVWVPRK